MYKTSQIRALALIGVVLAGCPGKDGEDGDADGDASASDSTASSGVDSESVTDSTPTGGSTSDTGGGDGECDPRAQDCPEGLKCTAYAKMAGDEWNANKCVDETGAGVAGDPCEIVGSDMFTGIDNCAKGYICQNPDEELKNGVCIEFCKPDDSCPNTTGGKAVCLPANEGKLPICLANCNPLTQDCAGNQACYGDPSGPPFFCYGPDPKDGGGAGSKCEFTNACLAGLSCADASVVEGCPADSLGCCTPFCSLDEMNCTGMSECAPFFDVEQPGLENVGICVLPG